MKLSILLLKYNSSVNIEIMSTGYFSYIGITSSGVSKLISPWEGLAGLYSAINLVFVLPSLIFLQI